MSKTPDSEKDVEAYLRERMKVLGGKAYKIVSPGNDGMPDRLCVFPGDRKYLVETKGKGGSLTASQKKRFPELYRLGVRIYMLWSRAEVDQFINALGGLQGEVHPASISGLLYRPGNQ